MYDNYFMPNDQKMSEEYKKDEICATETVYQRYLCRDCGKLVINPYFCDGCGYQYCEKYAKEKKCIKGCPNSKFRPICQKEKDLLNTIMLKCKNKGCQEFINYFDYAKHLRKCKYNFNHYHFDFFKVYSN